MSTTPPVNPEFRPPQPTGPPPQSAGPIQPPLKRKTSPIVWILVGLAGFFLLVGLTVVAGGLFVLHKVKQAGLDPDLMKRNPGLAMTKMITTFNPNVEVLSVNDGAGTITVKDKKDGKIYSMRFDDIKNGNLGKMVVQEDGKDAVTFSASSDGKIGGLEVKSGNETVKFGGANGKVPGWVPTYPGAPTTQVVFSAQGKDGETGSYAFKTKDPVDKVIRFYEDGLKSAGLKVSSNMTAKDGRSSGAMLSAESTNRSSVVIVGTDEEGTAVSVTYTTKP